MIQLNLILKFQLFLLGICPALCQHGIRLHAFLQILVNKIQTWLVIGNLRNVGIDTVYAGKDTHGCHTECGKGRHHGGNVSAALHINDDKGQNPYNKHRLNQEPWDIVHHRIGPAHVGSYLTGLIIVSHKKLFPVQHLHILKSVNRLDSPLSNSGLDCLVLGSDLVQLWFEYLHNNKCHHTKQYHDKQSHKNIRA